MDISEADRESTLEILAKDSKFLSDLSLIDYSLLVLKIRDLAPGESDDDETQALQIDENGVFQLRRSSTLVGAKKLNTKALTAIDENDEKEVSSETSSNDSFD